MANDVEWHILQSTMLRAVRYDPASHELRVRFTGGAVYRYIDVPSAVAEELIDANQPSAGRFFNDHIRDVFDFDEERPG